MNQYLKTAICLVALLPIAHSTQAQAQAQEFSLATQSGGELGLQVSNYNYEEQLNGAFFISTQGTKFGVVGSITPVVRNGWYATLDARYAFGYASYTGSGTKEGNPDQLFEGRAVVGKDFAMNNFLLSPYAGLGYRWLHNDLRGLTSTGAAGYRRTSQYTYIPLGLTHRMHAGQDARLSTSLEYKYFLGGTQRSALSDANARQNDVVNIQNSGFGASVSTSYDTKRWSLGVFYHYWRIEDSDRATWISSGVPIGTVMEPSNTTTEFGVQMKYRFH